MSQRMGFRVDFLLTQRGFCSASLHGEHSVPILALLHPSLQELHRREVTQALVGPHVIVHVVPFKKDLIEPLHRVSLPEGPELAGVGLDLSLHESVLA